MSNINKQELRTVATAAKSAPSWYAVGEFGDVVDPAKPEWKPVHEFCKTFTAERVLALLDELEAAEKRIAELETRALKVTFQRMPLDEMGSHRDGKKYSPSFGAGYNCAIVHCESEIREACAAAGISIKGE